jgi:hypothetical protein
MFRDTLVDHGQTDLVLPDRPSRSLGLRHDDGPEASDRPPPGIDGCFGSLGAQGAIREEIR